jgi:hypothetical protein
MTELEGIQMKKKPSIKYLTLTGACFLSLLAPSVFAQRVIRIGIVIDGPWERNSEIRETFEQEITALLRGEFDARFPAEKRLQADFTASGIDRSLPPFQPF